jgi:hypothetical protein
MIAVAIAGLAGCQQGAAPPTPPTPPGGEPRATACGVTQPPESWRTRLRGEVKTPDPRGRATLADKQVEPTLASLRAALVSDDQTRLLATLTAISVMDCRVLVPDVEQRMKGLPAPVVVEAAATLIELGRPQPGVAALKAALADASWPTVQLTAAQYLARADDRSGLPVVRAALASEQEAIRLQALQTAPVFAGGGLDVITVLEAAARSDPSWLVRREATEMLARQPRTDRIAAVLAHVAANDSDEKVRQAARRGLAAP